MLLNVFQHKSNLLVHAPSWQLQDVVMTLCVPLAQPLKYLNGFGKRLVAFCIVVVDVTPGGEHEDHGIVPIVGQVAGFLV